MTSRPPTGNIVLFDVLHYLAPNDCLSPRDLAAIAIEPDDRRLEIALAQIESEQADTTTNVDEGFAGFASQCPGRRVSRIAPQFPPDVQAEPKFPEMGGHPRAGAFVLHGVSFPVFHCVAFRG